MRSSNLFLPLATLFALSTAAYGQALPDTDTVKMEGTDSPVGFSQGGFVVAPIPIKNPTLGTGLALGGGYLFNLDEESASSYLGLGGFRTDNGSSGYGISGDVAWDKNRWNLGLTLGEVDIFYDYYVDGTDGARIPLEQTGRALDMNLKYGFTSNILVGAEFAYIESDIAVDGPGLLPPIPRKDSDLTIFKFGPTFQLDYRDDTIYPTRGSHLAVKYLYSQVDTPVNTRNYTKATARFDSYTTIFDDVVIATRAAACSVDDNAPFFDKCGLGSVDSFRGFPFGAVLDNALLSFQTELRGRLNDRFGYVLFAGVGDAKHDFSSLSLDEAKTSGGLGLRVRLSKKFPMDFSFDAVRASSGDDTYYIYVGQRF
ncbi:BamA/TamA family outer membrane protein [Falsihalocynthiibacter sp. SS001]|uniref:BamA/TamA family outer membrane protein n=1 Tax=Falsihalocynthiibacter sp. SS001 TaxID=3349698 RepID=UPI0036D2F75A